MDEFEPRDTISPDDLERLRCELVEAFDRIRQHLTWAEAMLLLAGRRGPQRTNSPPLDSDEGVAA